METERAAAFGRTSRLKRKGPGEREGFDPDA